MKKPTEIHSLDDLVKTIVNEPEEYIDLAGAKLVLESTYRSDKQDLRFGMHALIKVLSAGLHIPFCGLYLTQNRSISVERDPKSGRIEYDTSMDYDKRITTTREALLLSDGTRYQLIVPIMHRERYFGFAVFEKTVGATVGADTRVEERTPSAFSPSHLATIVLSIKHFAARLKQNVKYLQLLEECDHLREELGRVRKEACIDGVTHIYTRKKFDQACTEVVSEAVKNGKPVSVIMADIDHFKNYNDTYGHQAGDHVLGAVADIIRQNVRSADIFGRYGGEEFVVVLPDTPLASAYEVARRIHHAVRNTQFAADDGTDAPPQFYLRDLGSNSVTMSLGVASSEELKFEELGCEELKRGGDLPSIDSCIASLVRAADNNLYVAKALRDNVHAGSIINPFDAVDKNGLLDIAQIYPLLHRQIVRCHSQDENLAVFMYDALRFRELISKHGQHRAWKWFKDSAEKLRQELKDARGVARVCDGDRVVALYASPGSLKKFKDAMRAIGERSLDVLNQFQPKSSPRHLIDFALGVVAYRADLVACDQQKKLTRNPALLLSSVQHAVGEAEKCSSRMKLMEYRVPGRAFD